MPILNISPSMTRRTALGGSDHSPDEMRHRRYIGVLLEIRFPASSLSGTRKGSGCLQTSQLSQGMMEWQNIDPSNNACKESLLTSFMFSCRCSFQRLKSSIQPPETPFGAFLLQTVFYLSIVLAQSSIHVDVDSSFERSM